MVAVLQLIGYMLFILLMDYHCGFKFIDKFFDIFRNNEIDEEERKQ